MPRDSTDLKGVHIQPAGGADARVGLRVAVDGIQFSRRGEGAQGGALRAQGQALGAGGATQEGLADGRACRAPQAHWVQ